eukprot:179914-Hanusia_phi.AAC.1
MPGPSTVTDPGCQTAPTSGLGKASTRCTNGVNGGGVRSASQEVSGDPLFKRRIPSHVIFVASRLHLLTLPSLR